jgi:hypothetical protein
MKEFNINDRNKTTSGFKTPEGYFDQFTVDLNNKLKLPKTEVKVISIKTKRRLTTVAAILVVAFSVSIYSKMVINNSDESDPTENYLTNHSEINQYDLISLLDKKDIENLSIELNNFNSEIDEESTNINEIHNYLTD